MTGVGGPLIDLVSPLSRLSKIDEMTDMMEWIIRYGNRSTATGRYADPDLHDAARAARRLRDRHVRNLIKRRRLAAAGWWTA